MSESRTGPTTEDSNLSSANRYHGPMNRNLARVKEGERSRAAEDTTNMSAMNQPGRKGLPDREQAKKVDQRTSPRVRQRSFMPASVAHVVELPFSFCVVADTQEENVQAGLPFALSESLLPAAVSRTLRGGETSRAASFQEPEPEPEPERLVVVSCTLFSGAALFGSRFALWAGARSADVPRGVRGRTRSRRCAATIA